MAVMMKKIFKEQELIEILSFSFNWYGEVPNEKMEKEFRLKN